MAAPQAPPGGNEKMQRRKRCQRREDVLNHARPAMNTRQPESAKASSSRGSRGLSGGPAALAGFKVPGTAAPGAHGFLAEAGLLSLHPGLCAAESPLDTRIVQGRVEGRARAGGRSPSGSPCPAGEPLRGVGDHPRWTGLPLGEQDMPARDWTTPGPHDARASAGETCAGETALPVIPGTLGASAPPPTGLRAPGTFGAWPAPPDPRGSPGSPGTRFCRRWSVA
eukprot:gene9450-biopygen6200